MAANPRFLDRLNAVCTVLLGIILAGLVVLTLQARELSLPDSHALGTTIEALAPVTQETAAAPASDGNLS